MTERTDLLVTTEWLAAHLDDDNLIVLDATFTLPGVAPAAAELYAERHLPGARFFDVDGFADPASLLPHMLPDAAHASTLLSALGVDDQHTIVVYDTPGLMSAPRAWWTLTLYGLSTVYVLDGGLHKWQQEGRAVTEKVPEWKKSHFQARFNPSMLVDRATVFDNIHDAKAQLIDARSASRFTAEEQEKRPGVRAGHIPGSLNLPFNQLSNADGTLKNPGALRANFEAAGIDWQQPTIASCGSGVTACVLAFALTSLGKKDVSVYDGSWSEWGADPTLPIMEGK